MFSNSFLKSLAIAISHNPDSLVLESKQYSLVPTEEKTPPMSRAFISCNCGYEGSGTLKEIDHEVKKALILCPRCKTKYIKEFGGEGSVTSDF